MLLDEFKELGIGSIVEFENSVVMLILSYSNGVFYGLPVRGVPYGEYSSIGQNNCRWWSIVQL